MAENADSFLVTHDQSKPPKKSEEILRTMMTPVAPRKIGCGDRKWELPLRISTLDFGNSESIPQLQVADVIAGAGIDFILARSGKKTEFGISLRFANELHGAAKANTPEGEKLDVW